MIDLTMLQNQVFPHSTLSALLKDYARPNDKISELIAKGDLLPLKKGLYTLSNSNGFSRELIANHLSGPSYVSRYWALAYYGMMTEQVTEVTSMCIGRSRTFRNDLGIFSYHAIPARYYAQGQTRIEHDDIAFIIATPEKALCDVLVATRNLRIQSRSAMLVYLLDDLRMDEDDLLGLDKNRLRNYAEAGYKVSLLKHLLGTLEMLS